MNETQNPCAASETFTALTEIAPATIGPTVAPLCMPGEIIAHAYQSGQEYILFTNRRLIHIGVAGGEIPQRLFDFFPYRAVISYAVENAQMLGMDNRLVFRFADARKLTLEFVGGTDIVGVCRMINSFML